MYISHCNNFEHFFVCSYCCKLFLIIIFYLLPQVMYSVSRVAPCGDVTCTGYFVIDAVTKNQLE